MSQEIKVYFKTEEPQKNKIYAGYSKRAIVGDEEQDYSSHIEHELYIYVSKDGALYVTDMHREGGVYFYPDQLEHLQIMLEKALLQRDNVIQKI